MASILTNTSAMIALQTLRTTNKGLSDVQNQISTGKRVATAKDNAAIFAITQTMQSDVSGFKAISESLALGSSTVAVASNASKKVGELLNEIKAKIVAANEENVDRGKLQDEVVSLRNQIGGIVSAAQFNGLNLLSNTSLTAGSGTVSVLASLDRASDGTVASSDIDVLKQDLGTGQQTMGTTAVTTIANYMTGTAGAVTGASTAAARTITIEGPGVAAGIGYRVTLSTAVGTASVGSGGGGTGGTISAGVYEYVARDGDTAATVAAKLAEMVNAGSANAVGASVGAPAAGTGDTGLTLNFDAATDGVTFAIAAFQSTGAVVGGGLATLANINVGTAAGATSALTAIEGLIQTTIDAQAAFGTSEKRVEIQSEFMNSLIDSFKSGIGALVDADLEEASARLQALQVQQQLGVQALSIANQAPQNILALFR